MSVLAARPVEAVSVTVALGPVMTAAVLAARPVEAETITLGPVTPEGGWSALAVRPAEAVSVALGPVTTVSLVAAMPVEAVSVLVALGQ